MPKAQAVAVKKQAQREKVYPQAVAPYELPDLLEIQKRSYQWFLEEGLKEEFVAFSPITDYSGKFEIYLLPEYVLDEPKYSIEECRSKDLTYAMALRVPVRIVNKETGEIKESLVFVGDLPKMTDQGTFLVNGAERVVVSQIVRSPGVYFKREVRPTGQKLYSATVIPDRGAWLNFDVDVYGAINVHIDKTRRIYVTTFLRALGYQVKEMEHLFTNREFLKKTLERDHTSTREEALIEIYKKLRPGEPPSVEGGQALLESRFFDFKRYDLGKVGRYKVNKKLKLNIPVTERLLTREDIIATIDYLIGLNYDIGNVDDIDHLGNRRIRSVGELLRNQFRIGLARIERIAKEKMTITEEGVTPKAVVNFKPLVAVIREFFGSSQLSQFMDQTNPLAELTHKRRISALGPGGLTRERAGFAVRDIHPSHYGRICPIETPEGPNAGLITSLATCGRVNEYGFIETPYFKALNGKVTQEVRYLPADEEEDFRVVAGDTPLNKDGTFKDAMVPARYRGEFTLVKASEVDYISVTPIQVVSVGTALIPFLEHDDANRALMGSNMQRQAVPLVRSDRPLVGTGIEDRVAKDSGVMVFADEDGEVVSLDATQVTIKPTKGKNKVYKLIKYLRSNHDTCINQKPLVKLGDKIAKGQVIADGVSTKGGELALGRNIVVAFLPWEGYNFEDAVLISQRLLKEDTFTSIHITKYEIDARKTKLGDEEITNEIPNVSEEDLRELDEDGIVRIGAEVEANDILVGKVTPKGDYEHPPEERLLRAIFGEKAKEMRDTSLRVPHGERGRVVEVKVFDKNKGDELPPGVNKLVRVYLAQKRKIGVGDKVAGRHGNKGIVAKILPEEDMPYLPDGTPVDMVLNPLGVPSRMNVGQIYEAMLGFAADILGMKIEVPPFDERFGDEASNELVTGMLEKAKAKPGYSWVSPNCKLTLRDGRTGDSFHRPVMVGNLMMMKLVHLVDDKIHARSTGPYSLVTQQPLGGKAQFGGQRFGEMEVWALEAYGAAYILQEILTIKSDDVAGRAKAYEAIVKGKNIQKPGTPESFKVLVRELQSLGLDVKTIKAEGGEVNILDREM